MRGQLRPGGLAMIVRAKIPQNLGKVVEVIGYAGSFRSRIIHYRGTLALVPVNVPMWEVRATSSRILARRHKSRRLLAFTEALFPERCLMPLDDDESRWAADRLELELDRTSRK